MQTAYLGTPIVDTLPNREAITEEKQYVYLWTLSIHALTPPHDSTDNIGVLFSSSGQLLTQGLQSHVVSMGEEEEEEQYCPLW